MRHCFYNLWSPQTINICAISAARGSKGNGIEAEFLSKSAYLLMRLSPVGVEVAVVPAPFPFVNLFAAAERMINTHSSSGMYCVQGYSGSGRGSWG